VPTGVNLRPETSALPELPLVISQNIAGQQRIGCGVRNDSLPYSYPLSKNPKVIEEARSANHVQLRKETECFPP
jgi:hypothetical protein